MTSSVWQRNCCTSFLFSWLTHHCFQATWLQPHLSSTGWPLLFGRMICKPAGCLKTDLHIGTSDILVKLGPGFHAVPAPGRVWWPVPPGGTDAPTSTLHCRALCHREVLWSIAVRDRNKTKAHVTLVILPDVNKFQLYLTLKKFFFSFTEDDFQNNTEEARNKKSILYISDSQMAWDLIRGVSVWLSPS